ncbi:hypothetical protein [Aeromonas hydrophila]|uniref:hypothetical protein n=1 Tax=Aeromonas hydrophila TaxID=644 RepID=UPI0038CFAD92
MYRTRATPQGKRSKLEAEIQGGSFAGDVHSLLPYDFFIQLVMEAIKEEVKQMRSV